MLSLLSCVCRQCIFINPQSFCHTQNTSQSLPWPGGMDCVSWLLATSSKFTPIPPSAATCAFLHMLEHTEHSHPRAFALAATSPWITLSPFIPVSHSLTLHSGLYPNDIASKRSSGDTPFLILLFFFTFQPRAKKRFLALQAGQPWASGWSFVWGSIRHIHSGLQGIAWLILSNPVGHRAPLQQSVRGCQAAKQIHQSSSVL